MMRFPEGFFWGAATSSYQVEGDNYNTDWWEWEKKTGIGSSGAACRQYELYKQDLDLAKSLDHNAHRFSIEWSRIEPEEGKFSHEALAHYCDVILYLKGLNIEPIVTLHHFANPLWLSRQGGWENRKTAKYFDRYVSFVVSALADKVKYWITINEPMVYTYHSYLLGRWPPQKKSLPAAIKVQKNFISAHQKAYKSIHRIYQKNKLLPPAVSIAHSMQYFMPCQPNLRNNLATSLRDNFYNHGILKALSKRRCLDFIGMNYYSRNVIEVTSWRLKNFIFEVCQQNHHPAQRNFLGWDIYPEGLYQLLLSLKKYNLPVFILENGICIEDDSKRWSFIYSHLKEVYRAMQGGLKVLGYIYWSLIDNFEWDLGFSPRFGIIEVDYNTYKRTVRESAKKFSEVCKTNTLE